jgi:hypothetical protein
MVNVPLKNNSCWVWWVAPVTPATQEWRLGGLRFDASPGKNLVRFYLNKEAGHGGMFL